MKANNTKTLWKRENSAKHIPTEFGRVVDVISTYLDAAPNNKHDEVLVVLQQFNADRTGKSKELLAAVENVVENVKLDLVESKSGVHEVLRDVVAFLLFVRTTTTLEQHASRLDELLERLDFVASGGIDAEVPRIKETKDVSPTSVYLPKPPIKQPKHFEDPRLVQHVERLTSLNTLLQCNIDAPKESIGHSRLSIEQLNLANYFLRDATQRLTLDSKTFADKLVQEVHDTLKEKANKPVKLVQAEVAKGSMYRSLAEVYRRKLRDVVEVIAEGMLTRASAQILLNLNTSCSANSLDITFVGVLDALDLIEHRMTELSLTERDDTIQKLRVPDEEKLQKKTKTRKERIAHALEDLRMFVDSANGFFCMSSDNDGQLMITVRIPRHTRIVHTIPIEVGSDIFLLESNLLTAVIETNKAEWDVTRSHVEFADKKYRLCCIAECIKSRITEPSTSTWMLLLDGISHQCALEVQNMREPVLQIWSPSISKINHGHKFLGGTQLKLLLDLTTLIPIATNRNNEFSRTEIKTNILCLNVSQPLLKKIQRCVRTEESLIRHATATADAITDIQEYVPTLLIIEDEPDVFRANDAIHRIAQALPSEDLKLLVFEESMAKTKPGLDNLSYKVTRLSRSVGFAELKNVLAPTQDSAESVEESLPG